MKEGIEMAVSEINASGGLLGREIKVIYGDVSDMSAENVTAVLERMLGAKVDAVVSGYSSTPTTPVTLMGEKDIPYIDAAIRDDFAELVAQNRDKYRNVFQASYVASVWGDATADVLFQIPAKGGWKEPNKKIVQIVLDNPAFSVPANRFEELAKQKGYEFVVKEFYQIGFGKEWRPILSKIEAAQPAYIAIWSIYADDGALFMTQFNEYFGDEGLNTQIFMNYLPAMPEFLELAGDLANGIIWNSTPIDMRTPEAAELAKRWNKKFGKPWYSPFALSAYDIVHIWASAVKETGCADCYDKVNTTIAKTKFKGVGGTYEFNQKDLTCKAGEWLLPIAWYQIQNGKHEGMAPKRFVTSEYQKPYWIKK
jgi:branched-chain amino acid transport system substrate-binding protein